MKYENIKFIFCFFSVNRFSEQNHILSRFAHMTQPLTKFNPIHDGLNRIRWRFWKQYECVQMKLSENWILQSQVLTVKVISPLLALRINVKRSLFGIKIPANHCIMPLVCFKKILFINLFNFHHRFIFYLKRSAK